MSHTKHHNDSRSGRLLKLPHKYTGWIGENCWRQRGRRFLKRWQNRCIRRYGRILCAVED